MKPKTKNEMTKASGFLYKCMNRWQNCWYCCICFLIQTSNCEHPFNTYQQNNIDKTNDSNQIWV